MADSTTKSHSSSTNTTNNKPTILIIGTLDTKQPEITFLCDRILTSSNGSCHTKILDISVGSDDLSLTTDNTTDKNTTKIPKDELLTPLYDHKPTLKSQSRGNYVNAAITICTPIIQTLIQTQQIQGIIGIGGSTGSSLATALMRHHSCPVGFPKLMVSTMASGDVAGYIGETDITMMYSVVDIAGLNSILKMVLMNAAGAVVGMVLGRLLRGVGEVDGEEGEEGEEDEEKGKGMKKKRIAITMFGVTTPGVDLIRGILTSPSSPNNSTPPSEHPSSPYEIYVFHATGSGGRAMERLINESQIDAVIDLTTTEIADELFGGVLSAGPHRLEAAAKMGLPMIVSVGACDMINFGSWDSVPGKYRDNKDDDNKRLLHVHNPTVTLMRTTPEENKKIGEFIVDKLTRYAKDPKKICVLLPLKGVSMIDVEGEVFWDPVADRALFDAVRGGLMGSGIEVLEVDDHVNSEGFARVVVGRFLGLMG